MNRVQYTVLLIDDNIADRVAIRRALRGDVRNGDARADYRVQEVENGAQALAYLRAQQPDCLLLDYQLPDIDGLRLLQRIVEEARPHLYPVVMLTGADTTGLAVQVMQQGAHDFLPKDGLTAERLQQAIHNAIEKVNLLRQLEDQREWFRLTLASIGDAVIAADQTGAVTFMNPVAEALTGITAASAQGQPLAHLFRPLDENSGQPLADLADQVLHTPQIGPSTTHALLLGDHGTRLSIAYNVAPIQDRLGNRKGVVLTFRDVSARKVAEDALRESEARLRLGMTVAGVAIAEVDYTTNTIQLSPEAAALYGLPSTPAIVPRQRVHDCFHPDDRVWLAAQIEQVLDPQGAGVLDVEHRIVLPDGAVRWLQVRKQVFFAPAGEGHTRPLRSLLAAFDITKRKQVEESLRYQAFLLENVQDAIISTDINYRILTWNRGAEQLYGWSAAEAIGQPVDELLQTEYLDTQPADVLAHFYAHGRWQGEAIHRRKEGTVAISNTTVLFRNAQGEATGMVAVNRDMSVRKAAEDALRASQQRLQLALAAAQMGVWEWNIGAKAIYWSPEVYQINGFSTFDGTPATSNRTVYPDDLPAVQARVVQAIQQRTPYGDEFRILRPDGTVQWVATYGRVEYAADGSPLYLYAVIQNVTARKRAELNQQFLLDLNTELNRLHDADHIQQTVVERLGQYLAVSRCFFNQVDLAADRATILAAWSQPGELPAIDIYPFSAYVPPAYVADAQAGRTLVVDDVPHDTRSATAIPLLTQRQVQATIRVPCLRHGEWVASLHVGQSTPRQWRPDEVQLVESVVQHFWPLVEKSRAEAALRRQEEILREWNSTLEKYVAERTHQLEQKNVELERSNKELEKFAYVASHDLRSPLRAIDNLSKWLDEDVGALLPAASKEHLAKMRGRVQRMDKLLDDLLAYSRIGRFHHQVESVDVGQMVQAIIALLHIPGTFQVTWAADLPRFRTQRVPLEVVLRNLIGNAIKHHHRTDGQIQVAAYEEGDWLHFGVSDDGPGIDPQFHDKIFEIFQTLKPRDAIEGSGMGLAIVKKIIEIAGGTITVESSIDAGTTFRFTWPRTILASELPKEQK